MPANYLTTHEKNCDVIVAHLLTDPDFAASCASLDDMQTTKARYATNTPRKRYVYTGLCETCGETKRLATKRECSRCYNRRLRETK